ncbi:hypothetical protein BayCH28_11670 [Mycolicibacterium sp. CH28]|uniref:hypothetical protein n=1 Tax=Mycolicibacterium sp. CH28 TaxID=2512237 RepID=UPI001080A59F|nr:hypothetical protein [Mycolicibacterium sp. CH28]TGD88385.1 hypothetical protein BayCH28_11670 [Mycolicibacterium sp. CH28]
MNHPIPELSGARTVKPTTGPGTLERPKLDASFFRMHPGWPAESVLAAWGITTEGKPVFVGLSPGTGESTDAWADF